MAPKTRSKTKAAAATAAPATAPPPAPAPAPTPAAVPKRGKRPVLYSESSESSELSELSEFSEEDSEESGKELEENSGKESEAPDRDGRELEEPEPESEPTHATGSKSLKRPSIDPEESDQESEVFDPELPPKKVRKTPPRKSLSKEEKATIQALKARRIDDGRTYPSGKIYLWLQHPNAPPSGRNLADLMVMDFGRDIIKYLGPLELYALERTAKSFASVKNKLNAVDHSMKSRLQEYFGNPLEFRRIQARWKGLIFGHVAEDFFSRTGIFHQTILFGIIKEGRDDLWNYMQADGWTCPWPEDDDDLNAPGPFEFYKDHSKYGDLQAVVYCSAVPPVFEFLKGAPSTDALSCITWNKAFCLFPKTTFLRNEAWILADQEHDHFDLQQFSTTMRIYGHTIINRSLDEQVEMEMGLPRRIGDRKCWVINLNIAGLEDAPGKSGPNANPDIELTTFRLRARNDFITMPHYDMGAMVVSHGVLKHEYVTMQWDENVQHTLEEMQRFGSELDVKPIHQYLKSIEAGQHKIRSDTVLRLKMLVEDARPDNRTQDTDINVLRWDKEDVASRMFAPKPIPEHWPSYDDEMKKLLKAAWERCEARY